MNKPKRTTAQSKQKVLQCIDIVIQMPLDTLGLHNISLRPRVLPIALAIVVITVVVAVVIRNGDIRDLISHFHPRIARCRDRRDLTKSPVREASNDEASEKVQIVNALGADWDFFPDCSDESDNIYHYSCDIGGITPPVEAHGVVVGSSFLARVEIFDLEVAFSDPVVVTDHYTLQSQQCLTYTLRTAPILPAILDKKTEYADR